MWSDPITPRIPMAILNDVVRESSGARSMLHRTMDSANITRLRLDDLLADLVRARRDGDLGRLALLAYCEVRRWARTAGEGDLAGHAARLVIDSPQPNREAFLAAIDELIVALERLQVEPPRGRPATASRTHPARP